MATLPKPFFVAAVMIPLRALRVPDAVPVFLWSGVLQETVPIRGEIPESERGWKCPCPECVARRVLRMFPELRNGEL